MNMGSLFRIFFIALIFIPSLCFGGETSVAVMEFSSKGGIETEKADALSDLMANQIRAMGGYRVIGKSDIRAALDLEQQKSIMGCSDDSCIAELGGALGVQWVVVGNVSLFGKTYLLNLKVLDVANVKVIAGISRKVTGGMDMLIDGMSVAAKALIAQAVKNSGGGQSADVQEIADATSGQDALSLEGTKPQQPSNKLKKWGHITFWSGLGLFAVGAVSTGIAAAKAKVYQDENESRQTRIDAMKASESTAGLGAVGLIAGGALMVAGVVLWIVAPSGEKMTPVPTVTFLGDGDSGAVFGLVGRW